MNSTDPAGTVLVGMLNDSAALRYAAWGKSANSLVYVSNGNSQVVFVPDVEQLEVDFALSGVGVDGELFYVSLHLHMPVKICAEWPGCMSRCLKM